MDLDGLVSSLHLPMVFSDTKMCKMVAMMLDEECLSSDAIEMYFDFEEEWIMKFYLSYKKNRFSAVSLYLVHEILFLEAGKLFVKFSQLTACVD